MTGIPEAAMSEEKITIRAEDLSPPAPLRIELPPKLPVSPQSVQPSRRLYWVLLGLLTLGGLVVAGVFVRYSNQRTVPWTERIATSADRSVVMIQTKKGMGTGFVVASSGDRHLVLTNRHVVGNSSEVTVLLRSGHQTTGTVAGFPNDEEVDLAVVVVSAPGLAPMGRIASFASLNPGMDVAAIGHPLGLDYTITSGIISAKRDGMLIQTSAAISPGNSGGPLVDRDGDVVGVNTKVIDREHAQGLAFAVRADLLFDRTEWQFSSDVSDLLDRVPR